MLKTRPKAAFHMVDRWGDGSMTADQVLVDEEPEFSGLYNADGDPLYRERPPFGFVKKEG